MSAFLRLSGARILVALLAVVLLAAACGGDDAGDTQVSPPAPAPTEAPPPPAPTEAPTTTEAAPAKPVYGMVTAVDDQIGRILGELDSLGLAQDTIVLVSSDHGDMLGSHGQRLKRKPWEESIRIPGIVRYPRSGAAPRETEAFFTQVDFAPTLLSLCGVEAPADMQGADLSPVILGESDDGRLYNHETFYSVDEFLEWATQHPDLADL